MKLFRGANKGINKMVGGSFYTNDYEIAESYSELEENGIIYTFDICLNLFDADELLSTTSFDEGIESIMSDLENFSEIFENYEGISINNGIQMILFGTLTTDNVFTKQTLTELVNDATLKIRRYDR